MTKQEEPSCLIWALQNKKINTCMLMFGRIGINLKCPLCKRTFTICTSCYRGHRYCSKDCSYLSRNQKQKKYSRRYNASLESRKKHRLRQNRYRKKKKNQKSVTQQTSPLTSYSVSKNRRVLCKKPNPIVSLKICICCQYAISSHFSSHFLYRRHRDYKSRKVRNKKHVF